MTGALDRERDRERWQYYKDRNPMERQAVRMEGRGLLSFLGGVKDRMWCRRRQETVVVGGRVGIGI